MLFRSASDEAAQPAEVPGSLERDDRRGGEASFSMAKPAEKPRKIVDPLAMSRQAAAAAGNTKSEGKNGQGTETGIPGTLPRSIRSTTPSRYKKPLRGSTATGYAFIGVKLFIKNVSDTRSLGGPFRQASAWRRRACSRVRPIPSSHQSAFGVALPKAWRRTAS